MCLVLRYFAIVFVVSVAGCSGDRTKALLDAYHRAEPPNELFVEVNEAAFLGAPNGWQLLYYDFVWSGAQDSFRGTQKLLVFDRTDRFVGSYYLGEPIKLNKTGCASGRVTIVFESGAKRSFDFSDSPPKSSEDGELLYQPTGT